MKFILIFAVSDAPMLLHEEGPLPHDPEDRRRGELGHRRDCRLPVQHVGIDRD